jgi:hypothetical protein
LRSSWTPPKKQPMRLKKCRSRRASCFLRGRSSWPLALLHPIGPLRHANELYVLLQPSLLKVNGSA